MEEMEMAWQNNVTSERIPRELGSSSSADTQWIIQRAAPIPLFSPSRWTKIHRVGQWDNNFFPLVLDLDHSCQPRWEEEPNSSQQTHDDEHPEEDPVDDHRNVLPIFLHLEHRGERPIINIYWRLKSMKTLRALLQSRIFSYHSRDRKGRSHSHLVVP